MTRLDCIIVDDQSDVENEKEDDLKDDKDLKEEEDDDKEELMEAQEYKVGKRPEIGFPCVIIYMYL